MRNFLQFVYVISVLWAAQPAWAQPSGPDCPIALQATFPRLQDEKPVSLCEYRKKVLLVVNTASYCGFTPQYRGLEALYERYRERGLVVLGFPSNDFAQEKGSNREIADFCENTFGVKFPMFASSSVRGAQANPLYRHLAEKTGEQPTWNFHKYLIGRDGAVIAHYGSLTGPDSNALVRAIESALARQ